eukprot:TRINITY_DN6342_c0_g1_i10.p1 TRINITY_DN6342_c0_g1~~TRINITY_DN6342_c0_g1_i10.p1  ORF type:complete len:380 (+),score=72.86 TRINITY_DN6342_c0_g1_i10:84-1223(+)
MCIRDRYQSALNCFPYQKKRVLYACKANTNLAILKILLSEGCSIDAVSPGEVYAALKVGFKGENILYTGDNMSDEDINFAVQSGCILNCGALSTLEKVCKRYPDTQVCIRVNPDVGDGHHNHVITGGVKSKFGIFQSDTTKALEIAQQYGAKIVGIHQHIGSNILDAEKYAQSIGNILSAAKEFPDLKFIDIGGGFGIPYKPNETRLNLEELGRKVSNTFEEFSSQQGREIELWVEPGRFLVAESGVLLATVTCIKSNPEYKYVGIDSGFNHLVRPTMYGCYHEIINTSNRDKSEANQEKVTIVGNICESGDVFARDRVLPKILEGDVLAIMHAGAYGFSMSSTYNLRPQTAEVLLTNSENRLIRKRQTFEDLLKDVVE